MTGILRTVSVLMLAISFWTVSSNALAITAEPSNQSASGPKTWDQASTVEKVQFVCAVTAGFSFVVAEIWFIVAGFQASVGWGLFMLFIGGMRSIAAALVMVGWLFHLRSIDEHMPGVPLIQMILFAYVVFAGTGAIIFITRHWDHARGPVKTMVCGILLIAAVIGLQHWK